MTVSFGIGCMQDVDEVVRNYCDKYSVLPLDLLFLQANELHVLCIPN